MLVKFNTGRSQKQSQRLNQVQWFITKNKNSSRQRRELVSCQENTKCETHRQVLAGTRKQQVSISRSKKVIQKTNQRPVANKTRVAVPRRTELSGSMEVSKASLYTVVMRASGNRCISSAVPGETSHTSPTHALLKKEKHQRERQPNNKHKPSL